LLQRQRECLRRHGRANDEKNTERSIIAVGIINRTLRDGVAEFIMFHPANHTDNRVRLLLSKNRIVGYAPAEGTPFRPVTLREILIHHADALVAVVVGRLEEASLEKRDTHCPP